MKILLLQNMIYFPSVAGAIKAHRIFMEGMVERKHSCRVVAPAVTPQGSKTHAEFLDELAVRGINITSSGSGVEVFNHAGVEVHAVIDTSKLRSCAINQIREFEPDWILVSEDPGQNLLEAALRVCPSRVVYIAQTTLTLPFGPMSSLPIRFGAELFRQTAGIITISNYVKDYIQQWSGLESVVIPFPAYGSEPFPLFGNFDRGFVTMVNPCQLKGISIFLAIAQELPDVRFAAVPTWGTTKADRAALEKLPNIQLLKRADNIDDIFAQTRILLVPSLWDEAFGMIVVEAMLRGIPVLASNVGGLPEAKLGVDYVLPIHPIEGYENSVNNNQELVVPDQDISPWLKALKELLSNRTKYEQLSEQSRQAALAFVSSLGIHRFENFLENLAPASTAEPNSVPIKNKSKDSKTSDVLELVENLSPERRALLALRLKKKAVNTIQKPTIPQIPRRGEFDSFPLSFAQERLWFLEQFEPNTSLYNLPGAFRITGTLKITALEQTFSEIIRRHEALRTSFSVVNGQPIQVINPSQPLSLPVKDLSTYSDERETEILRLVAEEAERPFDLMKAPLMRASLLRLGKEEHILLLTTHHIAADGWSTGVLVREIVALYEAFSSGKLSPLPELPIQYADFAHWQRQWLEGEVLESQLSYWRKQLAGAPSVLQLPTDRPRLAIQTFRGASESLLLSNALTNALKALSQQEGATLFMILLAAFQTLLYRYSGQEDVVVGSPIANRNRPDTEPLIGLFLNNLILRTNFSGNPKFRELLARVREVAVGAYAHQDIPFEKLMQELHKERDLSRNPVFQVMFSFLNVPMQEVRIPGLTFSPLKLDNKTAKFDLTLSLQETEEGLAGVLEYNTDLFDASTICRTIAHFQTLLEAIAANPEQQVSELPLLTDSERHQLLKEWNETYTEYPDRKCIHQLFEAQVERTPDAVALVFEEEQLTYRELNSRANQLAHYLQVLGVEPEALVGICLERSIEMVVGLLGILKAGGAYVPLDPTYPQERLTYMVSDSQASIVLTQSHLLESLPESGVRLVCLDKDWEVIGKQSQENVARGATPSNLAYVIYTSGSTGKPKGVEIFHQSAVNFLNAMRFELGLTGADTLLAVTTICFDIAGLELYLPLIVGAKVVLVSRDIASDGIRLLAQLVDSGATAMQATPATWQMLLASGWSDNHPIKVFCGGEALPGKLSQQLLETGSEVWNLYGPTETTIWSTAYKVVRSQETIAGSIDVIEFIGRPIANTQIYILDCDLQPVPIGVPGELHIGGDGLARGYLNRPELTQERFIPNPFSDRSGTRLYKTGDLARYLPDGNIEYLGRIDTQVKIRGFRIELGEIEGLLTAHHKVQQAVVIARSQDHTGNKLLVAYIVAHLEPPTANELGGFLKQHLPGYMVPHIFVFLDVLPLTPNGKVDRRALPAPDLQVNRPVGFVPPRTAIEESLVAIWSQILGLKQVGIHDNFFELGGDSIISIQIIAQANQAGIQLTPKQIFQHQTIAELATVAGTTAFIPAEQGLVTGEIPLTPIQHWFFEQNLPCPDRFNQSVLLEVPPDLQPDLLEQAVQNLLFHHDALRLRFVQEESQWQQINTDSLDIVPFQMIDCSELPDSEQQAALESASDKIQASLNLSYGSLIRVVLFNFGISSPSRLLIVIHHLGVDSISWRILLEDLFTVYQQLKRKDAIQLPPKTTSFKDWALRLSNYGKLELLNSQLDYWLTQSWFKVKPLPIDYPSGKEDNTFVSAANVSAFLSAEQTCALLQEVPKAYNTQINDVLLTALLQSFAQWTGTNYLLVDLEAHDREEFFEDVNLSRTVGWFTSIFPVLLEVGEIDRPGVALKSVKEQLRSVPQNGIGYGILRYLGDTVTRSQLQNIPQAEVSFNYLGQFDQMQSASDNWKFAKESSCAIQTPLGNRRYLLNLKGLVVEGRLQMEWIYSKNLHQKETVEHLASGFMEALKSLIAHCQSPEAGGFTPSDFPDAELSQADLDELMAEIN